MNSTETVDMSVAEEIEVDRNEDEKLTSDDAKAYAKAMEENAVLIICAMCGEEGRELIKKESRRVDQYIELLKETELNDLHEQYTACL